ncbi:MAG TPA: RNA polymerase sigma factor [Verrucomicrobiae bacterium]|nr:RNA polymerase sigma factor [Verrucomicrobiae bacterium]
MFKEMHLVWRFNRGHTDALHEIYDLHKHDLVTLAAALLVDKAEAEDVVHNVFVGFIRSGGRFRLTGSLNGFLATCVANRARNQNKSRRNQASYETDGGDAAAPNHERPDLATIFGEELKSIGGALSKLPYDQREAVVLRLCSGMRFHAIARMQGVSINTVQSRYRYGLDKLKTLLNMSIAFCWQI